MIEGAPFAIQALERWPDKVRVAEADDGVPGITIEGRRYPEPTGPGAGCPPANSLNTAEGIDPTTVGGMLADADRELFLQALALTQETTDRCRHTTCGNHNTWNLVARLAAGLSSGETGLVRDALDFRLGNVGSVDSL